MKNSELVKRLEANLNRLLNQYDSSIDHCETKKAHETLRLIEKTQSLINDLGFVQMYGTYGIVIEDKDENGDDTENVKRVISVWEQNSQGQVRNQKMWEVGRELNISTLRPIEQKF